MTGGIATKFVSTTGGGTGSSPNILGASLGLMFEDTRGGINQQVADAIELVGQHTSHPERFNALVGRMKAASGEAKPAVKAGNKIGNTFPG